jgi:hypothetical protein
LDGIDKKTPLKRAYFSFYFVQRLAFIAIGLLMTDEGMTGV